jgi:hypothetical protein
VIATWRPSLRRTLLTNLVAPAIVLAVVLGIGGMMLIQRVVETTHDRLLDGSVLAIAERVGVEDGELSVDLPQVALGMLESQSHDSIYYSVTYLGELITGYKDLPLSGFDRLKAGETGHRDGVYRGKPVRIGVQARQVYGRPRLVLVAVAETVQARRAVEREMLIGLAILEAGLIGLVALLGWYAVERGLRPLDPEDIDNLVDTYGVVPGEFMSSVFSMMTPMRSLTKYNVDLIDIVDDEAKFMNFLRMEKWLADRPHHPGEAAKQWLKDLYQENRLVDGSFMLSGRQVDLKSITAPVLNVFALDDHIIPPDCSRALGAKIGSRDYTEIPLPGGHVGLFVSSKSQGKLSQSIADWLVARDVTAVSET